MKRYRIPLLLCALALAWALLPAVGATARAAARNLRRRKVRLTVR